MWENHKQWCCAIVMQWIVKSNGSTGEKWNYLQDKQKLTTCVKLLD